jgi:hypothetical protein
LVDNEKLRLSLQKAEEEISVLKDRVHLFESGGERPGYFVGPSS